MAALPFDLAFPVSSFLVMGMDCVLVIISIMLADFIISHGIEFKRIIILSLVGYFVAPIFGFFLSPYMPVQIPYLLPLVFWIVAGELLLKDYDLKNRALVAAIGYIIFIIMSLLNVSIMIISLLGI